MLKFKPWLPAKFPLKYNHFFTKEYNEWTMFKYKVCQNVSLQKRMRYTALFYSSFISNVLPLLRS